MPKEPKHRSHAELERETGRALATTPTLMSTAVAAVSGVAPHVLHHIGPLAGTAMLSGIGGTVVFGIAGIALSIPMLLRLRRRFGTWAAPALAATLFATVYLATAFLVGPMVRGESQAEPVDVGPSPTHHAEGH